MTHVFRCNTLQRIVTHRTSLRIVVSRLRVQVEEVFGRILTNTQVPDRNTRLRVQLLTNCVRRIRILVLILVLIITAPKLVIALFALTLARFRYLPHCRKVRRRLRINFVLPRLLPRRLRGRILLVHPTVLRRVIPVPPIALRVIAGRNVCDDLVRSDILAGVPGALLTRALEAVLLLVRHGAAVLACAFAELGRGGPGFGTAVVPVVEFVGGAVIVRPALMGEGRASSVEVPWCLGDIFCMNVSEVHNVNT